MRLDYTSIEIIKEVLAAREISINGLCAKLSISRRAFYYRLDRINDWLAENSFGEVRNRRSVGLTLNGAEKPAIQERLAGMANSVYELSGDERRSNILLLLLTTHRTVFVQTINTLNKVSRNTTLEDIRKVEEEIGFCEPVRLRFLKSRGYFIDGPVLGKRLCLFYFLQRSMKYKDNFLENAILRVLDENTDRIGLGAKDLNGAALEAIQETQRRLARTFTDKDCRLLRYTLLLFCLDVVSRREVSFEPSQREYLGDAPEFAVARTIRRHLEKGLGTVASPEEDYYLALILLVVKSHVLVPGPSREDERLVRTIGRMTDAFEKISGFPCHDREGLWARLFSHLRPAIHRCLFSVHLDNVLRDDITRQYPRLLETTCQAAIILEKEYGIHLSDDEMGYIAILFGAHLTPEEQQVERHVLLVTEGGICSTTLLERQLRELTILPLDVESRSVSEFLARPLPADVDLIVTTIHLPLDARRDIPTLRVKHILSSLEQHLARNLIEGWHDEHRAQSLIAAIMDVVGENLAADRREVVSTKITSIVNRFIDTAGCVDSHGAVTMEALRQTPRPHTHLME